MKIHKSIQGKLPGQWWPCFQATGTIFKLVQNIIRTNLLTKKNATPPWRPYFIGTNHLTKFHEDQTINVASRVLTWKNSPPPVLTRKMPHPTAPMFLTNQDHF
ncbi:hypothetical protein DPMN_126282 [Dreissena polymorpha]|uniref:Uncharacterized protein n=1 Tax=Dreissena polymorpha TaxID=45954 RepID=A0A9D4GVF0_DREPO|nr:hypothetical protein DPMN_126282 [Dreissena polymorpha]